MAKDEVAVLTRMREICLSLPDTKETYPWGEPHFRVGEKIFAGCGDGKSPNRTIGFKLEKSHAAERVASDPRFTRAPYVGQHGWVSMDVSSVKNWGEVRELVVESYRLIAPKRLVRRIDEADAQLARPATTVAKKKIAKKKIVKNKVTARKKGTR